MPKGFHHLTRDKRCQIEALKASGLTLTEIAKRLGIHKSTISRELSRNASPTGYFVALAHERAVQRRSEASSHPRKLTQKIVELIRGELIKKQWSPEQLSGWLKKNKQLSISYQSIYRYIWANKQSAGKLCKQLRHQGKRYKKRLLSNSGRGHIPDRRDITDRPLIVNEKKRIGDFEGDTIVGANHQGAIISLVDRSSKYVKLSLIKKRSANEVANKIVSLLKDFPHKIHTITFDNGKEFCKHRDIAKQLNTDCFFATPYRSWERGLNEHTNGLVRQYFPKGTDFSKITEADVQRVEDLLNHRPRKSINYATPYEIVFG